MKRNSIKPFGAPEEAAMQTDKLPPVMSRSSCVALWVMYAAGNCWWKQQKAGTLCLSISPHNPAFGLQRLFMLDVRCCDEPLHTAHTFSPQLRDSAGPPLSQDLFTDWLGLWGFRLPKAVICHLSALEAGEAITELAGGSVGNQCQPDGSAVHLHRYTSAR